MSEHFLTVKRLEQREARWVEVTLESGAYEVTEMRLSTREPGQYPIGARFRVTVEPDPNPEKDRP